MTVFDWTYISVSWYQTSVSPLSPMTRLNCEGYEWGNDDIPQDIIVKIIKLIQMVLVSFQNGRPYVVLITMTFIHWDYLDSLSDDVLWISHKFHLHQTINSDSSRALSRSLAHMSVVCPSWNITDSNHRKTSIDQDYKLIILIIDACPFSTNWFTSSHACKSGV